MSQSRTILHSLLFFPRGGSAHVAAQLCRRLMHDDHRIRIVAGSLGAPGDPSHAATFYAGLELVPVTYDEAEREWRAGREPMRAVMPFHPSYEDRGSGAPDRIFTKVSPELAQWATARWSDFYRSTNATAGVELFHVHHLTTQQEALRRLAPRVPIITHLHGTELKMLASVQQTSAAVRRRTHPHASFWSSRMKAAAAMSARILVTSPADRSMAAELVDVDADRITCLPNGVDVDQFHPRHLDWPTRQSLVEQFLVDEPHGWGPGGVVGSVRYGREEVRDAFFGGGRRRSVIVFVGRFTSVKRLNLLLDCFAQLDKPEWGDPTLVVWGGFPGEWEGEHPVEHARRSNSRNVFFAGWRSDADLARFLPACDLLVLPSVNESFGLALLEAMACGLPVVAVRRGGPPTFVSDRGPQRNGWLVEPDDGPALTECLRAALRDTDERTHRGLEGRRLVEQQYSWGSLAQRMEDVYDSVLTERHGSLAKSAGGSR